MDEKRFAIKETVSVEEVKMLRKKLGLTQRDFAGLLGCSKPTVERMEREGTVTYEIIGSGCRIYTDTFNPAKRIADPYVVYV